MAKIDPTSYIVDWDPRDEKVPNVASWYTTEYITIQCRVTAGIAAPSGGAFGPETLSWLMAQGWVMEGSPRTVSSDTLRARSSSSGTRTFSDGSQMHYSSSNSSPVGQWSIQEATFKRIRINPRTILTHMVTEFTNGYNEGRKVNDQRYDDLVKLYAAMVNDTQDQLATFDYSQADYQPLIDRLLAGIQDVAANYDAAVADRLGDMDGLPDEFKDAADSALVRISCVPSRFRADTEHTPPIVHALGYHYHHDADQATAAMEAVPGSFGDETAAISSSYGQGKIDEINRKFDALISEKKSDLVSRGLYNSTLYDSSIAAIERERAIALTQAGDAIGTFLLNAAKTKADLQNAAANAKLQVAAKAGEFVLSGEKTEVEVAEIAAKLESATGTSELSAASTRAEVGLKVGTSALDALAKSASIRESIANAILGVIDKMVAIKSHLTTPLKLRNDAFLAMFSFMERRTDEYPGLADIAKVINQVGYANGGTLVPSTSTPR